ncbi:hypothetical protein [Streptomyces sp. NPDC050535]
MPLTLDAAVITASSRPARPGRGAGVCGGPGRDGSTARDVLTKAGRIP